MNDSSRSRSVPRATKAFNRVALPIAGYAPVWAVLIHRGRKSSREYRTPVAVLKKDGVYRIALPWGKDVDWARNVMAAGQFDMQHLGKTVRLTRPRIVQDGSAAWAPVGVRQLLSRMGVEYHLEAVPG